MLHRKHYSNIIMKNKVLSSAFDGSSRTQNTFASLHKMACLCSAFFYPYLLRLYLNKNRYFYVKMFILMIQS